MKKGDCRIIKQLIVLGADTEIKSKEGYTPLELASIAFDENDSFDIETRKEIKSLF